MRLPSGRTHDPRVAVGIAAICGRRTVSRAFAWLVLSAAIAVAQAEVMTAGTVVDGDGKPVVGAKVWCCSAPPLVEDAFDAVEVVQVTTGADGRFRAALRSDRCHSIWATLAADGERPARASLAVNDVLAGSVVPLKLHPSPAPERFAIEGIGELGGGGPFSLLLRPAARIGPLYRLPIAADGSVSLPPLPIESPIASIVDAAGKVRVGSLSSFGSYAYVPPVTRRRCRVVDSDGRPVAGATISHVSSVHHGAPTAPFHSPRESTVSVSSPPTDAEGWTELSSHEVFGVLVAHAKGHGSARVGRRNAMWIQDNEFLADDPRASGEWPEQLTFRLPSAAPMRGRLRRGEQPLGGIGVLARVQVELRTDAMGGLFRSWFPHHVTTRTAADGWFEFDPLPGPVAEMQLAFGAAVADLPVLPIPRSRGAAGELDCDLAQWPVLTLQVLDAGAGPPSAARCVLLPADPAADVDGIVLPTDRAGRLRAQLEPGDWFVFATDGRGMAAQVLTLAAGSEPAPVSLALQPLIVRRGVLRDANGKPVVGARMRVGGSQGRGAPVDGTPAAALLQAHAMRLNSRLAAAVETDAEGRFELRFYTVPGLLLLAETSGCNATLRLEPGDDWELVTESR